MRYSIITLLGLLLSAPAQALEAAITEAPLVFVDRELVDSSNARVRFKGDIIGAGPTVISFTLIGCRELCPAGDALMNNLDDLLSERQRTDVKLVTLTISPGAD